MGLTKKYATSILFLGLSYFSVLPPLYIGQWEEQELQSHFPAALSLIFL